MVFFLARSCFASTTTWLRRLSGFSPFSFLMLSVAFIFDIFVFFLFFVFFFVFLFKWLFKVLYIYGYYYMVKQEFCFVVASFERRAEACRMKEESPLMCPQRQQLVCST